LAALAFGAAFSIDLGGVGLCRRWLVEVFDVFVREPFGVT
jgi:hypothetical protein